MDSHFPFFTVMDANLSPGDWTPSRRLSDVSSSTSDIESEFAEDVRDITVDSISTSKDIADNMSAEEDPVNVSREDIEDSLHTNDVEEGLGLEGRTLSARRRESVASDSYEML
jgi:hypothetical protein